MIYKMVDGVKTVLVPDGYYIDARGKASILMLHECKTCKETYTTQCFMRNECGPCIDKQFADMAQDVTAGGTTVGVWRWLTSLFKSNK